MLLFRGLTGSRLYGTHHANSDYDWIEIYDHCKSSQTITETTDTVRWSLSRFMLTADKGSHNALDAMFMPPDWPEVDLLRDFRANYRTNPYAARLRFEATIQTMLTRGDDKGRLHAERLAYNLECIERTGRYNPIYRRK